MSHEVLARDFYERIKPRLHRRIGRELRLAHTVIDLGCGSCDLVRYLASTYRQEVTGIDISSGSFPSGRHTQSGTRFRCRKKDASMLNFVAEGTVDAVVTMWALHEMERPEAVLAAACRVLRPGGEVFIVDFPRNSLAQKFWNEDYYRPNEVKAMLRAAGFQNVQARLIEGRQVMWARGVQPPVCTERHD
jgi:ubiquinone/menaquinone biosynthesis C-methylase UbiE